MLMSVVWIGLSLTSSLSSSLIETGTIHQVRSTVLGEVKSKQPMSVGEKRKRAESRMRAKPWRVCEAREPLAV